MYRCTQLVVVPVPCRKIYSFPTKYQTIFFFFQILFQVKWENNGRYELIVAVLGNFKPLRSSYES